jgi:deazaflavin-dependent oxidoreductase (nitroreductase family)
MASEPTTAERNAHHESVMAELRAHGGRIASGQVLIILTITGAKTGHTYTKPVCVREDGPDLIIAASAGGQPSHPQWYKNLVARPDLTVEYLGQSFPAVADTVANGPDRDRLFSLMSREIPGLYGYQDRCRDTRQIPIVRLRRS